MKTRNVRKQEEEEEDEVSRNKGKQPSKENDPYIYVCVYSFNVFSDGKIYTMIFCANVEFL